MIKTILVPLNGSDTDAALLSSAARIAQPFCAHLDCFHIEPSLSEAAHEAVRLEFDEDAQPGRSAFENLVKTGADATTRAQQTFDAFCARENILTQDKPSVSGRVSACLHKKKGDRIALLTSEAHFHDLSIVASGQDADSALPQADLGTFILRSGRPVLLLPTNAVIDFPRTVAIAWKDTPEAAHAVSGAMPIIKCAHRVVVLIANEDDAKAISCLDCVDGVVNQLRWHGVEAEARYIVPAGRDIPGAIFESARDVNADLLIVGSAARSRLAELVFGGVTQWLLAGPSIPAFVSH